MKLYYSPTSPYVRKVSITALVTGLSDSIERVAVAPHPVDRDQRIVAANPLGKAPTLTTDDGLVLFDSRVIIEYLDAHSRADRVLAAEGTARWRALSMQALGDGILDAALLLRYESLLREEADRSEAWQAGQLVKITAALDVLEAAIPAQDLHVGTIAIGSALGFLDFRLPYIDWRSGRDGLAAWFERFESHPHLVATRPVAPSN